MIAKTIFGIDLGTTYSCIAKIDEHGQPVVLSNIEGYQTTPSVVYFESSENVCAGENAKDAIPLNPDRVAVLFKRVMGDEHYRFKVDGKEYRPQQLSAFVLRKLADDAEIACGQKVEEVVITCPAYFGIAQKEATKQAGELAGLKVHGVIPEPTAAAIAYGMRAEKDEVVLVYDLGGGTFDITLIDIRKEKLTVLTTGGDAKLGGGDWDKVLSDYLASKVAEARDESIELVQGDKEFNATALIAAEDIKRKLTNLTKTTQMLSFQGERVKIELTRDDFEAMTAALLGRTIAMVRDTMRIAAEKGHPKPTRLCLVGGSSFMPQVRKALEAEFPGLEMQLEDPNQIVAKGAALFGLTTALENRALEISNEFGAAGFKKDFAEVAPAERAEAIRKAALEFSLPPSKAAALVGRRASDITSRGFAIQVFDETRNKDMGYLLVHVDDSVPATPDPVVFGLKYDDQKAAGLVVFETERRTSKQDTAIELAECKQLGDGTVELDRGYPRGTPIEVTLGLSSDGTLDVSAVHKESGRSCKLNMKVTGVMSEAEMQNAKQDITLLKNN